ncbi:hypothetical protein pb186bvf_011753 [Paramecium bursaria]
MITITLLDVEPSAQLTFMIQSTTIDQQQYYGLPVSAQIQPKDFRIILKDGNQLFGSISFQIKNIKQGTNAVRWITLFDPKDDLYDGNMNEDDIELPRILIRIEYPFKIINDDQKKLLNDYRELQKKFHTIQDDLLKYREMTEQEIAELQKENQQLNSDIKQLMLQNQSQKQNHEQIQQESIQEIQTRLNTFGEELSDNQIKDKLKTFIQGIQYESIMPKKQATYFKQKN